MEKLPTKFFCLSMDLGTGIHNFRDHDIAVMLTNIEPQREWENAAQVKELDAINGYPAGGFILQKTGVRRDGTTTYWLARPVIVVAKEKAIGPFRWEVLYNKTAGRLISFLDYGGEDDVIPGQALTLDFGIDGFFITD